MATLTVRQVICIGRKDLPRCVGYTVQKREKSDVTLTNYKRGTGGRSSFSGQVVTVFGATGFVGRYVVNKLGKIGSQMIIPWRGDFYYALNLKPAADLGQMLFHETDVRNDDDIRKALQYSNTVVNLLGRDWETRNFKYNDIHATTARKIAKFAKEAGVEKLIHFSSMNASPNPQICFKSGGSDFLKSKYEGELAVREEFPEAIIFRPADIMGEEDRFIKSFMARTRRRAFFYIPLWKKGEHTIKQPVWVSDVAQGVINALNDPDAVGKTYELVGPDRYYLSEIIDYAWRVCRYPENCRMGLDPLIKLRTKFYERNLWLTHGMPKFCYDKLEKDSVTDVLTGCPTLEDLNVKLTPMERVLPYLLQRYVRQSFYAESIGEFPTPDPPVKANLV